MALTRAKDSLVLLTEKSRPSPFIEDVQRHASLTPLRWDDLPPAPVLSEQALLEIRVYNSYHVMDELKNLRYRFNSRGKYWGRATMAAGFSFDALLNQPWAASVRIEVYSYSGELLHESGRRPRRMQRQ